jgi:hypothetical protein
MISRVLFVITSCATLVFGQGVNPLSITQLNPTSFQLSWYANTLRPYQIENSPDLLTWAPLTNYIEGTNAQQGVLVTKTTDKMFFRLRTGAMRPGFDSKSLTADDDANSSDLEPIGFPINIFPTTENPGPWEGLYVNNNGNVTVGTPSGTYTPLPLQSSAEQIYGLVALLAPFWGDVDTRLAADPETANGSKVVTYGQGQVDGRPAFGVNWANVGYYTYSGGATDKLNSFQLVMIDRSNIGSSGDFDVEFNYNQMLWETGEASGGSEGYGGTPARVGITNGVDRTIEAQYSGETLVQLDANPTTHALNSTTGLIYRKRNSTVPGRQVFQFRSGALLGALQVYAGPDQSPGSVTTATLAGTASDPSGGAVSVLWTVVQTNSTTPVVFANSTLLNTTVSFSAGASVDLQLTVRRNSDPTVSASDIMTINH